MAGMRLEKAYVETIPPAAFRRIAVLFNPAEYSLERANAYKSTAVPGLGSPLIQFVNGDSTTLAMDLFLDDYTDGPAAPDTGADGEGPGGGSPKSTVERMQEIIGLLEIDPDLHAPPPVRFVWGPLRFDAVLEKVGRKVTLFHPSGAPARATLSVSFREFRPLVWQLDQPRRQSADKTKRRRISASETIWMIAERELGDSRGWRHIAEASDVDDPRSLRPGDWLKVPPLEGEDGRFRAA